MKFEWFRDFIWVLQAFLRGKLLRQKAYRPQGNFFRLPVPVTAQRITMLMKWWGHRSLAIEESSALIDRQTEQNDDGSNSAPVLKWDGEAWGKYYGSGWDNYQRFIVVPHK